MEDDKALKNEENKAKVTENKERKKTKKGLRDS